MQRFLACGPTLLTPNELGILGNCIEYQCVWNGHDTLDFHRAWCNFDSHKGQYWASTTDWLTLQSSCKSR